ncbi:hypothetical protein [Corynebacterium sp.]|uniref:hypothetical protein n=1 Tax=Corynebacterium sp. TaxID=1720 RepID=UPI0026DC4A40|nr:hypothetical protein [Corynebacterium sp.]MDO4610160.1 hypothetical protein [Corynebacterium sp.]
MTESRHDGARGHDWAWSADPREGDSWTLPGGAGGDGTRAWATGFIPSEAGFQTGQRAGGYAATDADPDDTLFAPYAGDGGQSRGPGRSGAAAWMLAVMGLALLVVIGSVVLMMSGNGDRGQAEATSADTGVPAPPPRTETITTTTTATATATPTPERDGTDQVSAPGSGSGYSTWGFASAQFYVDGWRHGPHCRSGDDAVLGMESPDYQAIVCDASGGYYYQGMGRNGGTLSEYLPATGYEAYSEPRAGGTRANRWQAFSGDVTYQVSPNGITIRQGGEVVDDDESTFFAFRG